MRLASTTPGPALLLFFTPGRAAVLLVPVGAVVAALAVLQRATFGRGVTLQLHLRFLVLNAPMIMNEFIYMYMYTHIKKIHLVFKSVLEHVQTDQKDL
jgi:hypothetical protein